MPAPPPPQRRPGRTAPAWPVLLLALLLASPGRAGPPMSAPAPIAPIALVCQAGQAGTDPHLDGMCAALRAAAQAAAGVPVVLLAPGAPAPEGTGLTLHLRLLSASPTHLRARLDWSATAEGAARAGGAERTFSVMDTVIDARFYDGFADRLLRAGAAPLP